MTSADDEGGLGLGPDVGREGDPLQRFSHQAMATTFEAFLCHPRPAYAAQAAHEAFEVLDRLEQQLSRFLGPSDVSRINGATPGDPVLVGQETFECLLQARAAHDRTGGTFDVTAGAWAPAPQEGPTAHRPQMGMDQVRLDERTMTVTRLERHVQLDLGAIGKGYALDKMAQVLDRWGITTALLHGGASTALAMEPPEGFKGWPVTISCPFQAHRRLASVELRCAALSGSAQVRHTHIVDPRTGLYPTDQPATWSYAPCGALADALSTAFVVMRPAEVAAICAQDPGIGALLVLRSAKGGSTCQAKSFGNWLGGDSPVLCQCL